MRRVFACLCAVVLLSAMSALAQEIPNLVRQHQYGDGQFLFVGGNRGCDQESLSDLQPGDLILLWAINVPGQGPFAPGGIAPWVDLVPPITDANGYVAHLLAFVVPPGGTGDFNFDYATKGIIRVYRGVTGIDRVASAVSSKPTPVFITPALGTTASPNEPFVAFFASYGGADILGPFNLLDQFANPVLFRTLDGDRIVPNQGQFAGTTYATSAKPGNWLSAVVTLKTQ